MQGTHRRTIDRPEAMTTALTAGLFYAPGDGTITTLGIGAGLGVSGGDLVNTGGGGGGIIDLGSDDEIRWSSTTVPGAVVDLRMRRTAGGDLEVVDAAGDPADVAVGDLIVTVDSLPIDVGFNANSSLALPVGTDLDRRAPLAAGATAVAITCSTDNAPAGGPCTVAFRRVSDGATIASVSVVAGSRLATAGTITTASLVAGDVLRLDIDEINGVTGFHVAMRLLTRNSG